MLQYMIPYNSNTFRLQNVVEDRASGHAYGTVPPRTDRTKQTHASHFSRAAEISEKLTSGGRVMFTLLPYEWYHAWVHTDRAGRGYLGIIMSLQIMLSPNYLIH